MESLINTSAPPIAASLNSVTPGANPNPHDAHAVMHLCPLETVAKEKLSFFCSMFSEEDVEIYEYAGDLEKFYNRGYVYIVPSRRHVAHRTVCQVYGFLGTRSRRLTRNLPAGSGGLCRRGFA